MKKIIFMAALVSMLASCLDGFKSNNGGDRERDSLRNIIDQKDNELNDLMGTFNEIQQGFDLINEAEGRVNMMRMGAENNNSAENIRENMQFIQETLDENKRKIEELQSKLKSSSINSAKLKEAINSLTQQLTEKNAELEKLRAAGVTHILIVDDGVNREVRLNAVLVADLGYLLQIRDRERACGMRTHVQFLDAEIDRVSTRLDSCRKTLSGAYGSHNLKITQFLFHQMLRYDTGNGVLVAFHVREERLGSAETQEHIKTNRDMVTVVGNVETYNLLVLSFLQFHIREFQTAVFLTVVGLDG